HGFVDGVVRQHRTAIPARIVESVFRVSRVRTQQFAPQTVHAIARAVVSSCGQTQDSEAMNLLLDCEQSLRLATPVAAQRLPDEREANPLVGLPLSHSSLSEENNMTTLPRLIVEKLHQLDAMPGHSEADRSRRPQFFRARGVSRHRASAVE